MREGSWDFQADRVCGPRDSDGVDPRGPAVNMDDERYFGVIESGPMGDAHHLPHSSKGETRRGHHGVARQVK